MNNERMYIAIDLKSFYASVECMDRGLDPMTTNLVVADASRTEKTICLAVSPSLKAYGIPGRARLFEVVQRVNEVNSERKSQGKDFEKVTYHIAPPRMARYVEVSSQIYRIYLKYVAPEDIHVYSIDEVFIDVSRYLDTYGMTARELAIKMIRDVLDETGITATVGIGTNLYVCKVAMDIVAKHMPADEDGARIAELNERTYRELLWDHQPLTDFWRVGRGYQKKLQENGLYTMGDVARCSIGKENEFHNEELLYKLFGVNAELLIDHAWGYEPCTIAEIKNYKPTTNSISSGQVLHCPYTVEKGKIIIREMTELLVLDLVEKKLVTDQIVLTVGYDIENLTDSQRRKSYKGEITVDHYGRKIPKHAHGTTNFKRRTSSTKEIVDAVLELYDRIMNPELLIRRVTISANHVVPEDSPKQSDGFEQLQLFVDYEERHRKEKEEKENREKERALQEAMISIKKKYGKNAILKGTNLQEGGTTIERNKQIGGHKA
ncbi:MAG: DNA methylase [Eubacterium sp.]|nr:DNA methylase [Eubacterium sp.]